MNNNFLLRTLTLTIALVLFHSYNASAQWVSQTSTTTSELTTVVFVNSTTGFTSGGFSNLYKTTDGGNTWALYINVSAKDLYFYDANNGYAASVAGSGTMKRTTNGGATWTTLTPPNSSSIWGTFATSASTVYFIATDNKVHKSANGGAGFLSTTLSGASYPTDIFFTDANTGFITDQSGKIWKTTDAGGTWSNTGSVTTEFLTSIYFVSPTVGFACGTGGKILKTTNGGTNWTALTTGSTAYLTSIRFADANNGLAVGYSGTILRTSDGGATWKVETSGTTQHLFSVWFITNTSAITVGANGTILKNSNLSGIQESAKRDITTIYPNPFSTQTIIELEAPLKNATLTIENYLGQTVKEIKNISRQSVVLQRDNLQKGIYFVRLSEDNKIITTKKIEITD